jgi:cytochrome c
MHLAKSTASVMLAVLLTAAVPGLAQDMGPPERRGAALVAQHCAMCHAVGKQDESAEPRAPAFRTIGRRVALDRLEAQLTAGLLGGHPAMPKFAFEPRDAAAIVRYLRSIQEP